MNSGLALLLSFLPSAEQNQPRKIVCKYIHFTSLQQNDGELVKLLRHRRIHDVLRKTVLRGEPGTRMLDR